MMREAIRDDEGGTRECSQRSSEAIKRHSEAISGNQWQSEAIKRHSEAIRRNQRQSVAIRGNEEALRGHSTPFDALLLRQVLLELLEIFELRQKPLKL